ncbi:hypothetical protein F5984_23695 [Rudanella paleaurantiibacter]|uniref:Uncharacterized protein n=1 Tax=Rudanella paleaurantiibacter TaxID=2614655 RepID=A0A7J5TUY6_9BACT|nr:hypothetical protein [Rudanella paleaurantiibacter]KAB7726634.1 hypothetical protein F5984_23695 [Rudanella paleaurantiibacter]
MKTHRTRKVKVTFRVDDFSLAAAKEHAVVRKQPISTYFNEAIYAYARPGHLRHFSRGGHFFYPVLMSDAEIDAFCNLFYRDEYFDNDEESKVVIRARKACGGKGLEFMIDEYLQSSDKKTLHKILRHSFLLTTNWHIESCFRHWLFNQEEDISLHKVEWSAISIRQESIDIIPLSRIEQELPFTVNPKFETYDWTIVKQMGSSSNVVAINS